MENRHEMLAEKDIFDNKGRLIIAKGTTITSSIKEKLLKFNLMI